MMFKDKCKKCGKKVSRGYDFCPYCGNSLNNNSGEEWGMLGENDSTEDFNLFSNSFFGKMTDGIMGKMLNNAMRVLEKEMQKGNKNNFPKTRFKLVVNGKEVPLDSINQRKNPEKKKTETKKFPMFSEEKRKQFQKLKREEPKTSLKRFSDKIICEMEIPGLKSADNLSILKLENSIEIKAIGNKKAYEKIIRISSPIINYSVSDNNLILEFGLN